MSGTGDSYVYGTNTAGCWLCDVCGRACECGRVTRYLLGGLQLCPLCVARELGKKDAQ